MGFFNIATYLDRFYTLTPTETVAKKVITNAIKHEVGISIESHEIDIRKHTIYLRTHPAKKNEIVLKRGAVLRAINNELRSGSFTTLT